MKRITCGAFIALFLLSGFFSPPGLGRITRSWTYEELVAESDFVGLVEPTANEAASDTFSIETDGGRRISFEPVNTRFRVNAILKSSGDSPKEVTVLHFLDTVDSIQVANGPILVDFPIGPLQYEKRILKNNEEVLKMTVLVGEPLCLAFLKRRSDGRYEPITGQADANGSFREVHPLAYPQR
jgi:hypothetical protein